MLDRINRLKNWHAAVFLTLIGFATYFIGLKNQFLGDDQSQILNNTPAHSITNIRLFFDGGTYTQSSTATHLSGVYYRPLMTTVFSAIYTLFGAHPFYYHLIQLMLYVGGAIFFYLFLRYSFKPALALFIALIFIVHPLNSQVVYEIATLQDALFFFFGMLAIWILVRYQSVRALPVVILCLILSMLSKETGLLFVLIAALYLLWWNRKRLYAFLGMIVLPLVGYVALRIHAVGLIGNPQNGPIDSLSLAGRLMTAPSIFLFYISKFIFPWKLASDYFWVFPHFSVVNVLLPLILDLIIIGLLIYLGVLVSRKATKPTYYTYLFFGFWFAIGMLAHLQIFRLDATATESWFYFPMAGLLGMLGIIFETFASKVHIDSRTFLIIGCIVVLMLGVRSAVRGPDWSSPYNLAQNDFAVSHQNYDASYELAVYYQEQGAYSTSQKYAKLSLDAYPDARNTFIYGTDSFLLTNYADAYTGWNDALRYEPNSALTYDNLSMLTVYYGTTSAKSSFLSKAVKMYPNQAQPWLGVAVLDYRHNQVANAKKAINEAYTLDPSNQLIAVAYKLITSNQPL